MQNEVRMMMKRIKEFINRIPSNKQTRANLQVQKLIKDNLQLAESDDGMKLLLSKLENKYNFYKLSYPQVKVDENQEVVLNQDDIDEINISFYNQMMDPLSIDRTRETQNNQKGKQSFKMENGKLVEGNQEVREKVDFSNWYASNVDPEDLKRHRELLDRQHYRGPYWPNGRPKSILEEPPIFSKGNPEEMKDQSKPGQKMNYDREDLFENVKR